MCFSFISFFKKTNGLCSPGHKMLGLGMGMEWLETGNSCVAVPALQIAPKCFLKVDVVRKKQNLPTFPQSSDFPPPWISWDRLPCTSFLQGLYLLGQFSFFKAKHSPTCISLRESLLDLNSRSYWFSQEVIAQFTLKRGVTGMERCTGRSGIQLRWPSGQGERTA